MTLGYNLVLAVTGLIGGAYATCSVKGFSDNFKKFLFTSENKIFDLLSDGLNVYFWATFICKFFLGNTSINYNFAKIIGIIVLFDFIIHSLKESKSMLYLFVIFQLSIPYLIGIYYINL